MRIAAIQCRTNTGEIAEVPVAEILQVLSGGGTSLGTGIVPKSNGRQYIASGISVDDTGQIKFDGYGSERAFTGIATGLIGFTNDGRLITLPLQQTPSGAKVSAESQSATTTASTQGVLPFFTDSIGTLGDTDILNDNGNYSFGGFSAFWKVDVNSGSVNIDQRSTTVTGTTDGYRINGKLVLSFDPVSGELTIGNTTYTTTNIENIKTDSVAWNAVGGGTITDIAEGTAGNYTLIKPAENGTYATREFVGNNYWKLGGNALTESKTLGSTTAYDITLIANSINKMTLYSGAGIVVHSDTTFEDDVTLEGAVTITSLVNAITDVDKFLVSDVGVIKYRTGTQLLSDIGAFATPTGLTTGTVPKWNGTAFINSSITDSGTVVTVPNILVSGLTASQLIATDASKNLVSLSTATYPSLTELSYVKGVTSSIQTQLGGKESTIIPGTTADYWRGDKTWQTLNKAAVGLGNVDNTSDLSKPVSTATQTVLDLKANLAGPTFTGTVILPSTTSIGTVSNTEIGYLDGVTSGIQSQLDGKFSTPSGLTTNYVTKWNGTALANSLLFDNGSRIGISQATPLLSFEVNNATGNTYSRPSIGGRSADGTLWGYMLSPINSGTFFDIIRSNNLGLRFATESSLGGGTFTTQMFISSGGSVGIGTTSLTGIGIRSSKAITGGVGSYGVLIDGQIQSDVTSFASLIQSNVSQSSGGFTTSNIYAFIANQGVVSSTVTNLHGFFVNSNMIGGVSNFAFRTNIAAGSGRWGLYFDNTVQNYLRGNLGIGSGKSVPAYALDVSGTVATTNFIMTSGAGAGKILQSDGSGNATWVTLAASGYLGTWNPSTNTPTIANGTGTAGQFYIASSAGTWGGFTFAQNDQVWYNGSVWQHVPTGIALPIATASVLGGIKIGSGLSIDGGGVVSVATLNQNTTGSAASLTTSRNIEMTGDVTWDVDFNGSVNVTAAGTLATVNSNIGTYAGITVNGKGLVTAATALTTLAEYGITDAQSTLDGVGYVKASGTTISYDDREFVDTSTLQSNIAGNKSFTGSIVLSGSSTRIGGGYGFRFSTAQTYNGKTNVNVLLNGDTSIGVYSQLKIDASDFMFSKGNVKIGGAYSGAIGTIDWATEKLDVDGNIRLSGSIKPDNVAPTAGYFLKGVDADNMTWAALTTGDISNLSSYTGFDGRYSLTTHNHSLNNLSNVTITSNTNGEILKWNGTAWINNTLAEAGIQPAGAYLTSVNLATNVTGILPIANGGTGSSTQNFVDLTTNQTNINGNKTFNGTLRGAGISLAKIGTPTDGWQLQNTLSVGQRYLSFYNEYEDFEVGAMYSTGEAIFGNFLVGGGSLTDVTESLVVNGNIRYSGTLKPSNSAGTGFLKSNGTNDQWVNLTASDIPNLDASKITTGTFADARIASAATWNTAHGWGNHASAGYLTTSAAASTYQPIGSYLTGNQSITLSGIITGSGTTAISTAIADGALSIAKTAELQTILNGKQPLLPSGTAGQFLVRNASNNLDFMNLELEPQGLSYNKIAVGDGANYLSEYDNFEYREGRYVAIFKDEDPNKAFYFGMNATDNNSFVTASGGHLKLKGTNGIFLDGFAGFGARMVAVDGDGKLFATAIPSGGTGGTVSLSPMQIGFGSSGGVLSGSGNFQYDATKTAMYLNDGGNYLYLGKSSIISDMWEMTAVGTRGIQLNTDEDIVIKNSNHLYLGAGIDNKRIHIGRGATHNDANHYIVINGERFSFSMSNVSGWGDTNSAETPQVGDKVLFNVVDVGGEKRFVPQKINKKLFSSLGSGDTVLIL